MIKKIYIILTTILISLTSTWMHIQNKEKYVYGTYNSIWINQNTSNSSNHLYSIAETFADEHQTMVYKRFPSIQGAERRMVYQAFGHQKVNPSFPLANDNDIQNSSELGVYLVEDQNLTPLFISTLQSNGYQFAKFGKKSVFYLGLPYFTAQSSIFTIFIFFFFFFAISIITKIKKMASFSIYLLHGKKKYKLFTESLLKQFPFYLSTIMVTALLQWVFLNVFHAFESRLLPYYFLTPIFYIFILLIIESLQYILILISLHYKNLVSLLKGYLPVSKIMIGLYVCQCLVIFTSGVLVHHYMILKVKSQELSSSAQYWSKFNNYYQISDGLGIDFSDDTNTIDSWSTFVRKQIRQDQAFYCETNLYDFGLSYEEEMNIFEQKNVILVSPNYFKTQQIQLPQDFLNQLYSMKTGEFGVLFYEQTPNQKEIIEQIKENISDYGKEDNGLSKHTDLANPKSYVYQSLNPYSLFVFENFFYSVQQWIDNPIVIILHPDSLGDSSSARTFWTNAHSNFIYFEGEQQTKDALRQDGLIDQVSSIDQSLALYTENIEKYKTAIQQNFISTIVGLICSIILFYTINLLYFESFRKELFVYWVNGMPFIQMHRRFIINNSLLILASCLCALFYTKNIGLIILLYLFFNLNYLLLLKGQQLRQNQYSITILKGK